jgi:hypothetical protein
MRSLPVQLTKLILKIGSSPYGSATTAGTPSSRESPSSELSSATREPFNGHVNDVKASNGSTGLNGSILGSLPAVPAVADSDTDSVGKSMADSTPSRANIKALTNKQRNWFSSFEKGKSAESVDSSRRTSVKSDSTPAFLSGGSPEGPGPARSVLDVTPTPPANLNLPGDRRPLSAKAASDSIDDYLKNWKKTPPARLSDDNDNSFSG